MSEEAKPLREDRVRVSLATGGDSADASLEALWSSAESGGAVVAPPHPLFGGSLDVPVVEAMVQSLHRVGLSSLRFNWRGVGSSTGTASGDEEIADADYDAAIALTQGRCPGSVVGCGYSFGAATAIRASARGSAIDRLVLVAPPIPLLDRVALQGHAGPVLIVVGDRDEYAPLDQVQDLAGRVPRAELVVLEGNDHFFMSGGLVELGAGVERWLLETA